MMKARGLSRVVLSQWQSEGRGARVRRSIGRPELTNLDPFLLLDEFEGAGEEGAGFPDHPHRGFETVSYLLEGEFLHEDFAGNKGTLRAGDLQWMTAGRGIVHSEMPGPKKARGLQLWVNLAKEFKMVEPAYQELTSNQIPEASQDGVTVKVIAGESMGVKSQVRTRTPTYYLDFSVQPGGHLTQPIPVGWTAFAYILQGSIDFGTGSSVEAHSTVVLEREGEGVSISNKSSTKPAHLVLIAGKPIGEPVAQRGPFVMNTEEELNQAFRDFRRGENGFEKAKSWKSLAGN